MCERKNKIHRRSVEHKILLVKIAWIDQVKDNEKQL